MEGLWQSPPSQQRVAGDFVEEEKDANTGSGTSVSLGNGLDSVGWWRAGKGQRLTGTRIQTLLLDPVVS